MAGELSLSNALAAGHLVRAHIETTLSRATEEAIEDACNY